MWSYLITSVEGLERVGESLLVAVLGEGGGVVSTTTHAPVPVPDQGVGNHQGNIVRVAPATS